MQTIYIYFATRVDVQRSTYSRYCTA